MKYVPDLHSFVYFNKIIGDPSGNLKSIGFVIYRIERVVTIVEVGELSKPKDERRYYVRSIYNIKPVEQEKAMLLTLEQ